MTFSRVARTKTRNRHRTPTDVRNQRIGLALKAVLFSSIVVAAIGLPRAEESNSVTMVRSDHGASTGQTPFHVSLTRHDALLTDFRRGISNVGWNESHAHAWSEKQPSVLQDENQPRFSDEDIEFFERSVRPILVDHCFECHGPDSDFEGNLSLSSRVDLLEGGDTGPAIDLDDSSTSLLIEAVNYGDLYQMPPESKLSDDQIAVLTEWVERGAPWTPSEAEAAVERMEEFDLQARRQSHWCWQPITRPDVPEVSDSNWARDEIDRFILARLEANGLTPNDPASKRTWIRRVTFDLIGLPPSIDEVEAFLADDSDEAYERVVDRLLDSPHFGERWARHWMDLVRYAETCGHEFDYPIPHAWQYRDYLIRLFNADVPFDEVILEHIAGDLMTHPRRHPESGVNESIIGTGFWFLGEATHAPVDVRENEAGRVDNQIDVMSKTFLGLTVSCARCHDHKFDAISTKDYYALAGFLQSSRRQEAVLVSKQFETETLATLAERQIIFSELVADHLQTSMFADLDDTVEFLRCVVGLTAHDESVHPFSADLVAQWQAALAEDPLAQTDHPAYVLSQMVRTEDRDLNQTVADAIGNLNAADQQHRQWLEASTPFHDFRASGADDWFLNGQAFQWLQTPSSFNWHPSEEGRIASDPGSLHSGSMSNRLYGAARSPTFTITHPYIHYRLNAKEIQVRLIIDGYTMDIYNGLLFSDASKKNVNTNGRTTWITQGGDLRRYIGHRAHIEIIDHGTGAVALSSIRFSDNGRVPNEPALIPTQSIDAFLRETSDLSLVEFAPSTIDSETILLFLAQQIIEGITVEQSTDEFAERFVDWVVRNDLYPRTDTFDQAVRDIEERFAGVDQALAAPMLAQAMTDGTPENEYVFIRGNHRVLGDEVVRRPPEALADRWTTTSGSGRLELAKSIADPRNPLTSRVYVNRLWHHLFGRGIVASVDNFGLLGQEPTHPELLDYLAADFTTLHEWSTKSLIKRLVLSQTYRMSSRPQENGSAIDPDNLLLHRMRVRRLQGEAIRDAMLFTADQLDRKLFGPSVPIHLTPFMQGRGRPGRSGPLDGNGRRSLYIEVRRNFLSPMMLAFDTPIPFSSMGRRSVSNVPAQALILMNDPFVHAEAKAWAESLMQADHGSTEERIEHMYMKAFARPPSQSEVDRAKTFLEAQGEIYGLSSEATVSDVRVWADLGHVLFNSKEFTYLN